MIEEVILQQPTWKEWLILKNIAICKDTTPTYKKKWAERINTKHFSPTFSKVLNMLETMNILKSIPWIGRAKNIDIDIKKLDKFIENTQIYKEFRHYIHTKELFVVGV